MSRATRGSHLPGRRRWTLLAVTAAGLVAAAGLNAGPAQSAPSAGCPAAYPESSVQPDQHLTGLTVTTGTTPGAFTGTVSGVLSDGIAPGVDMIVAQLDSATLEQTGVWEGMSGSPVYATNGDLVGAVSYSLGTGPSTIAGITPAAEMDTLVTGSDAPGVRAARSVALPRAMKRELVRSGAASAAEVSHGLTRIPLPLTISGLTGARLGQLAHVLTLGGGHLSAGSVSGAAVGAAAPSIPIVAGGNLAASTSYGTVTSASLGTATMVCGDQVVGFGHPVNFTGPTSMTMHGASTVVIQDDPVSGAFKVANLGAPVGTIDNDRLAGIHGVTGAAPASIRVTSVARDAGPDATGTTHITDTTADTLPELAFATMTAVQDRALDRSGGGSARASWTIAGVQADGTPFSVTRVDRYADSEDISTAPAVVLSEDLYSIGDYGSLRVTSIDTDTTFEDLYKTYRIHEVQVRRHGHWRTAEAGDPVRVRAGHDVRLRVHLTSHQVPSRTIVMRVAVPKRAVHRTGTLRLVGGNSVADDAEAFYARGDAAFAGSASRAGSRPGSRAGSTPGLLDGISSGLQHNQVRATLVFPYARGAASDPRVTIRTMTTVVGGHLTVPVVGVR